MTLQISTLRPGILVALSTSVKGNVSYTKKIIDADHEVGEARVAAWETERTIADAKEHEKAIKTRSKIRSLITGICARSHYGLLCPEDKADKLTDAVKAARDLAAEFNATANITRIEVYVMPARINPDEVEAARAIRSELRDLIGDMQDGLRTLNAKKVREAADKMRSVGQMLSPALQEKNSAAISVARGAARRMMKAALTASAEVDTVAIEALTQARTAFLDLSEDGGEIALPAAPEARQIEIEASEEEAERADLNGYQPEAREIEMEPEDDEDVVLQRIEDESAAAARV